MSSKVFAYSIILGVCFVMDLILIFFSFLVTANNNNKRHVKTDRMQTKPNETKPNKWIDEKRWKSDMRMEAGFWPLLFRGCRPPPPHRIS